jgi:hypothetical protein
VLPAAPLDARDAEFLDALDQLPEGARYVDPLHEDADLYAALDDFPDTPPARSSERSARESSYGGRAPSSADDEFASELDDWSDMSTAETIAAQTPLRGPRGTGASRRYSAADVDLTDDEVLRQRGGRRTAANRARATTSRGRGATAGRAYDDVGAYAPPRRRPMTWVLPVAIAALLALAGVFWLLTSRVTVAVSPPAGLVSEHPFTNEVIPLAESGSTASRTAVQARPVSADAEATVTGEVTQETLAPTGTAKGTVTIVNTIGQAVTIPQGAEFIGKNEAGQDVRFLVDSDVTVPGATTTSSLTGSSTTYGQATASITARSAGSASNVPLNSITTLLIPGQQPLVSQNSNFIFQNEPIGGGSEAPQRVVTETEVQAVLQEALTQLYNNGIQQLRAETDESEEAIDPETVAPSAGELGSPENYQVVAVEPAIGQAVDPASPVFRVTVRARFSALATPAGKPVQDQLGLVVRDYFQQRGSLPCKPAETPTQDVTAWLWDGQRLTIDGVLKCTPANALSPEAINRVKDAVRGQSLDTAEAGLKTLQDQGVIGEYTLPAGRDSFPRFDWLVDVEVGPPPAEPGPTGAPQPTQPQPTQSTP